MDPKLSQKLQTRKRHEKNTRRFVYDLVLHLLIALSCSFFSSYCSLIWLPPLFSSTLKQFLFVSAPRVRASIVNPKCLFLVMNVIVVILIGESRLRSSSRSSPACGIYGEYVEKSRSIQRRRPNSSINDGIPNKIIKKEKEETTKMELINIMGAVEEDKAEEKQVEFIAKGKEDMEEDGSGGLPDEELNRRVENFIARVNKQRWLEARSLMCHGTVSPGKYFDRSVVVMAEA